MEITETEVTLPYDDRGVGASRPTPLRGLAGTLRGWVARVAAGRHGLLRPRSLDALGIEAPDEAELLADLAYGRE